MEAKQEQTCDPLNYLVDSFWASLPEKTADELATFKKDVLKGVKDTVDWMIDEAIKSTDRHLENARRMREQYRQKEAEDIPPNPA
jgi:hypothetical protein